MFSFSKAVLRTTAPEHVVLWHSTAAVETRALLPRPPVTWRHWNFDVSWAEISCTAFLGSHAYCNLLRKEKAITWSRLFWLPSLISFWFTLCMQLFIQIIKKTHYFSHFTGKEMEVLAICPNFYVWESFQNEFGSIQ